MVACRANTQPLILATTTSVANSGLLDRLLPSYVDGEDPEALLAWARTDGEMAHLELRR